MGALIRGLPDSAPSKTTDPETAHWGLNEELLAQLVEEVSVLAAERRRKEPRSVPRPWEGVKKKPVTGMVVAESGAVQATGLDGMLAMSQRRGAVNLGG